MRIAFVTFEYPPFIIGGAGVYALNVTQELAKLGHKIIVFTPDIVDTNEVYSNENLEVVKIKINKNLPLKSLQFWLSLPKEVSKQETNKEFDIVHFNGISYHFLKNKISNAFHLITIHHLVNDAIKNNKVNLFSKIFNISSENNFILPFVEKMNVNSGHKIISVSNFTKRRLIDTYHLNQNQIKVIHNGIDLGGYDFSEYELNELKKHLNLVGKDILLFVGRINDPRKGLNFLFHSLKNISETSNVMLIVVGNGNQENARKLSESLGISKNVLFVGYANEVDLKKYYSLCDIYICPSRLEGFGLTILEAMAAGKPIVATKAGAIPEILEDGVNGILVDSGDSLGLSNAISSLIKNKSLLIRIGERNAEYVKNKFNWSDCVKSVEKVYIESLLSNSR